MLKQLAQGVLLALLCLGSAGVRGELVAGLYSAEVPVADRSERALAAAAPEALAEVVLKVTGSEAALALPDVRAAIGEARRYVQQYAYVEAAAPTPVLGLRFQFDEAAVRAWLVAAGAPLWTANRPEVLVWLVTEDGAQRTLQSAQTDPALQTTLRAAFKRRGVPLRLPLLDLVDLGALSPAQVWRQDVPALVAASARYGDPEVLAGRVLRLSTGQWLGDWMHINAGRAVQRAFTADTLEEVLALGAGLAASQIAARFAIAAAGASGEAGVLIEVRGVDNFADYAAVIAWLQSLELVDFATPEQVEAGRMLIRLRTVAEPARLLPLLELDPRLQPLPAPGGATQAVYTWAGP